MERANSFQAETNSYLMLSYLATWNIGPGTAESIISLARAIIIFCFALVLSNAIK